MPGVRYAGFWLRLLAYVIDAVLINIVAIPLNLLLSGNSGVVCVTSNYVVLFANNSARGVSVSCSPTGAGVLIYFLLGLVYFTFMWSTGATLGQRVVKIRVVDTRTRNRLSSGEVPGQVCRFLPLGHPAGHRSHLGRDRLAKTRLARQDG